MTSDRNQDKGTFEKVGAGVGGLTGKAADTAVGLVGSMIRGRVHFENARTNTSYDTVKPLYQFGHLAGQNPDYQGRSFEDVETDLKTAWSGDQANQYGDWDTVREYISTGYSAQR